MALTDINSEERLVQQTFAEHQGARLGSIYAYNAETFGPAGTLGRASEREVVPVRYLTRGCCTTDVEHTGFRPR